jgi:hypothetical protein
MMKQFLAGVLTAALLSAPATVGAQAAKRPIADPFLRADASFSRFPLNKPAVPQTIGRLTNGASCDDDMILCEWQDARGVVHIMGGKLLAIKVLKVAPGDRRPIAALGIGTMRSQESVIANVRKFLPEIPITCLSRTQAGEGEGLSSCSGSFKRGGWFKLIFDSSDQLISARIDAFQIN